MSIGGGGGWNTQAYSCEKRKILKSFPTVTGRNTQILIVFEEAAQEPGIQNRKIIGLDYGQEKYGSSDVLSFSFHNPQPAKN